MSFRSVIALVAASTVAACTLFSGLDGFTDTTPDEDGGASDGTASTSTDGAAIDGETNDASAMDGAKATGFCANVDAALCEDFDDDMPLEGWARTTNPGAELDVAGDAGRSPPNAVRATIANFDQSRAAFIARKLTESVTHARFSYSLFIEEVPASHEIEVSLLRFNGCPTGCASDFYVAINNIDSDIVEQGWDAGAPVGNYHTLGGAIPRGEWVRIAIEVVLTGTKEMVLAVDGVEIARKPLALVAPGVPTIHAGITFADEMTPNGVVLIDDVVFEVLP